MNTLYYFQGHVVVQITNPDWYERHMLPNSVELCVRSVSGPMGIRIVRKKDLRKIPKKAYALLALKHPGVQELIDEAI